MGGIAEFERKLITARCEEGIAKARANGKKFGRPPPSMLARSARSPSGMLPARPCHSWRLNMRSVRPRSSGCYNAPSNRPREAAPARQGLISVICFTLGGGDDLARRDAALDLGLHLRRGRGAASS